jgi:dihydroorotase (multifunctional complex type)
MTIDTIIKDAKIVSHDHIITGSIAIDNGIIVGLGNYQNFPKSSRRIDAKGNFVLLGIIDPHVHWGTKKDYKLEVRTESQSCAHGGVTTVMTLLGHAKNYTDGSYLDTYEKWKKITENTSIIDTVFSISPHTIQHVEEIPRYKKELGVTCFKFFMGYKGEEGKKMGIGWVDDGLLFFGLKTIGKLGYPAIAQVHAENADIFNYIAPKLIKEGKLGLASWTEARPNYLESLDAVKVIAFAKEANCPLYIVHVSAGETVDVIQKAKAEKERIIAETVTHYLAITKDNQKIGNYGKVNPPLRGQKSVDRLWQGINEGTIDLIGTDNVPCYKANKKGSIWDAHPGIPNGSASLLPIMLSEGVHKGRITIEKLVEVCCYNTAKILGIYPQKGTISVGSDADLVIVDMKKTLEVTPETLQTGTDFTIFDGWKLKGWPILTMVRGNIIMEGDQVTGKLGTGKIITPNH